MTQTPSKGNVKNRDQKELKPFVRGAAEPIKHILANFNKNYQFSGGENMNPDGTVALLDHGRMVWARIDFL